MNDELLRIWREVGTTIVFVTHSLRRPRSCEKVAVMGANQVVSGGHHRPDAQGRQTVIDRLPRSFEITSELRNLLRFPWGCGTNEQIRARLVLAITSSNSCCRPGRYGGPLLLEAKDFCRAEPSVAVITIWGEPVHPSSTIWGRTARGTSGFALGNLVAVILATVFIHSQTLRRMYSG